MRFDAATYPGSPPAGPTLVYQGRTWPLRVSGDAERPFDADAVALGAPVLEPGAARWSLAYGANADPRRLIDKALDVNGAVVLPASVVGWRRVWEARVTVATGAVPLTLARSEGERLDGHVLAVHPSDTSLLDASEGRGTRYALGRIGPVAVADRFLLADALAYGPAAATQLLTHGTGPAGYPELDQPTVRRMVADPNGVRMRADALPRVVPDGWPSDALGDLPLLAYGTLQPGGSRWDLVADLVEVVGGAATRGRLTATYFGYPAAELAGDGHIRGTLLRPTSPRAGRELLERTDRVEDAPALFRRRAVPVRTGERRTWALVYVWNPAQGAPPGTVVADGRWTGDL